jgi:hypothetical protein
MTKTNTTFSAEIATLSDSELSTTVGGWGCGGYGYGGGYGKRGGYDHCRKDYGCKDYGYGGYDKKEPREVNQTANVVVVINQNA